MTRRVGKGSRVNPPAVTLAREESRQKHALTARKVEIVGQALTLLIQWGAGVAIAFFVWKITSELAAKTTTLSVNVAFSVTLAISVVIGGAGAAYGLSERKRRKQLQAEVDALRPAKPAPSLPQRKKSK